MPVTKPIVSYRRWGSCALLLAAVLSGCADSTGAGGAHVDSIDIEGMPAELYVDASVQLSVTLRDASQRTLSGRAVSWTSSDTSVVSISQSGVATGRRPGSANIRATSESQSRTMGIAVSLEPVASVVVAGMPADPVPSGTTVQLAATAYSAAGRLLPGRAVAWRTPDDSVATVQGATGVVQALKEGTATIIADAGGTATASVALRVRDAVASVTIEPAAAVLGVGQTLRFQAVPRAANGSPLIRQGIAWSTSDPQRAAVDSTGTVRALATGEVVLTAAIDGGQGTAVVQIQTRLVADWSQATEWTTHQGNGGHTGYVPVVAEPARFRALWVRTWPIGSPGNDNWIDGIIEGAGKVFVAGGTERIGGRYPGERIRRLLALDPATGQTLWTQTAIRDFNPPAYGDGRVYVSDGRYLYAYDVATGTAAYRSAYENVAAQESYAPVVSGGKVYLASGTPNSYHGGVYAFRAADGQRSWTTEPSDHQGWTPAVAGGRVYAYTGVNSLALTAYDAATGAPLFRIPIPGYVWNSSWSMKNAPAVGGRNNVLSTYGGRLFSFDLQAHDVGWVRTGSFRGDVTVAEGVLYVINGRQVEARSESDGSLLWAWTPPQGQPEHSMIATRNLLFVTTGTETYALDLSTHEPVWWHSAGGYIMLTRDGVLLIAHPDGRAVTAIGLK